MKFVFSSYIFSRWAPSSKIRISITGADIRPFVTILNWEKGLSRVLLAEARGVLVPAAMGKVKGLFLLFSLLIELDRQEGVGDQGEDMQQRITGRNQTRVTEIRTTP